MRIRKRIEEPFGWIKTIGGGRKLRYIGRPRNRAWFKITAAVYNIFASPLSTPDPPDHPPPAHPARARGADRAITTPQPPRAVKPHRPDERSPSQPAIFRILLDVAAESAAGPGSARDETEGRRTDACHHGLSGHAGRRVFTSDV